MGHDPQTLSEHVRFVLRGVIDPEIGLNIIDLGLVYDVTADAQGNVSIVMTTTTRGCPATGYLKQASEDAASSVVGVSSAQTELTYDPPWSPSMIDDEAKKTLNIR
ncbi:MAG TPA: metal-sulfur cluster assembly factor [Rhizomicrobium sp.]|nr:metal-sulfur cluster assembly factor [Rhizomicrobium sp.]